MESKLRKKTLYRIVFIFDILVIAFSVFLIIRGYNASLKSNNKRDDVSGAAENINNDLFIDKELGFTIEFSEVDTIDTSLLYDDPSIDDEDLSDEIDNGSDVDINTTHNWATYIPTSTSYRPFVNGTQRALNSGDCKTRAKNCVCPTVGNNKGFFFTMKTNTGREMKETYRQSGNEIYIMSYSCSGYFSGTAYINKKHKAKFQNAYNKLCKIVKNGIDGYKYTVSEIHFDGTLSERTNNARTVCSNHAYGSAIDINSSYTVKVNGVTHNPYGGNSSDRKKRYDKFVKAIGGKTKKKNVNYILWKKVFEPSGFSWGGNWTNHFDPMHYEVN